ncbi:Protein T06G6.6 b [Aphelenchoides avenae]|nr:Protein T06G6.6 b [Aphelenchus avenae]
MKLIPLLFSRTFLLFAVCVAISNGLTDVGDAVQDFRQYTCIVHDEIEVADCRLTFVSSSDELTTITDSGCFMEKDITQQELRNLCPIQCSKDHAYVLTRRPDGAGSGCIQGVTFGMQRRRTDWFMWRSGDCLTAEIQFDIRCTKAADGHSNEVVEGSGED